MPSRVNVETLLSSLHSSSPPGIPSKLLLQMFHRVLGQAIKAHRNMLDGSLACDALLEHHPGNDSATLAGGISCSRVATAFLWVFWR